MGTNLGINYDRRDQMDEGAVRSGAAEIAGGSTAEALAGAAAVVLGILALIGLLPVTIGAIATIAAGVALLIGGGAIAARFARIRSIERRSAGRQMASSSGLEAFMGLAAVALGILALLGVDPLTLMAVAAIVLGAGVLMAAGAATRMEQMLQWMQPAGSERRQHEMVATASASDVLVGLGAVVLGILALLGLSPLTLTLVAMIAVGATLLFSGSALTARFSAMFGG